MGTSAEAPVLNAEDPVNQAGFLRVDDLRFRVHRGARRGTLQITVERTGELVLYAPPDVDEIQLRNFVLEKRFWIYTKLAEKDRLHRPMPRKEFVGGEGFLYLGRNYRLKLVDAQDVSLKLVNGRFALRLDALPEAREHFIHWYGERGRVWLSGRVAEYRSRMEARPAGVRVRDLGYRWGSCGKDGWLYFHWKTLLLPPRIVEYVVVHELAHLHHRHHTPAFWQCVERAMPDYERRKIWLAEHGMEVEGVSAQESRKSPNVPESRHR